MTDPEPRLILVGPARLLHLQVEPGGRKDGVSVFRVPRRAGTSADCRSATERVDVDVEVPRHARHPSLDVTKDEVVCAKVERKARLSWHSRALPATPRMFEPAGTLHQASFP